MAQRENINCQLTATSRLRIAKFADFSEKIPPGPAGRLQVVTNILTERLREKKCTPTRRVIDGYASVRPLGQFFVRRQPADVTISNVPGVRRDAVTSDGRSTRTVLHSEWRKYI